MYFLTAFTIVCAVIFGGGTRSGFLGDVVVQVVAVPLFLTALYGLFLVAHPPFPASQGATGDRDEGGRWAQRGLLFSIAALAALQLTPLPPGVAHALMRGPWEGGFPFDLDIEPAWRSISLTPLATLSGIISLIVPAAIFLAVASLDEHARLALARLLVVLGALSLILGFLQVAQGPGSALRFYRFTNPSEAVGFFANRNHFAALMYVTLVLAGSWLLRRTHGLSLQHLLSTHNLLVAALAFALVVAVVAGLAMARSRAGILLTMGALLGLLALAGSEHRQLAGGKPSKPSNRSRQFFALALGFAAVFALQLGMHRIITRFESDPLDDLRIPLTLTTLDAAWKSLPFGTGIGSFVEVFGVVEKPSELLRTFANRAHNDLAEWLLEAGVPGMLLLIVAAVWFTASAIRVWRGGEGSHAHRLLQRAATIILALLLAHSAMDYPLRTTALMAIAAFAAAVLVPLPREPKTNIVKERRPASSDVATSPPVRQQVARRSWGEDIAWPDAWRQSDERGDKPTDKKQN